MISNETLFEIIMKANKEYVKSVDECASKEVQESLLTKCRTLHQELIIGLGLTKEYSDWLEETK